VLFGLFLVYGVSGYAVYTWKRMKGRPVSVIATQIDDPTSRVFTIEARDPRAILRRMTFTFAATLLLLLGEPRVR
jgi:hypothetical protein